MAEETATTTNNKPWDQPKSGRDAGLFIWNSLTNSRTKFIPAEDNKVSWYICGPTVYDSSHLGHARNYMTFDILRRIMTDYFKYNVFFVMNVTDIDDKIIVRSHFRNLQRINQFILSHPSKNDYRNSEEGKAALEAAKKVLEAKKPTINDIQTSTTQLLATIDRSSEDTPEWLKNDFDIQVEYLKLANFYENEFFEDLESLNIKRPDGITRVSEYVPEIITFIEKIIENGFAYQSGGDVYFDLQSFTKAGFTYNKCSPATLSEQELNSLLAEGEGQLSAGTSKKNSQDFALWKTSKPGEPKWASPWGEGRPGWHIECSAMAGDMLGANVDINCGGVDLRFPHHDNQLAQSEAKFNNKQWVNYFLHTGHLHIGGLKMSKSEKNFITIRECLKNYTKNQLRFLFLLHRFNAPLDIDLVGGKEHHGELKLVDATLGAGSSILSLIQKSQYLTEHSLSLPKGLNLFETFALSPSSGNLNIVYFIDGEEAEREWEVVGGVLQEEVQIRAGGRIKQMEEAIQIEKLFNDFFANVRTIIRLQSSAGGSLKWGAEERKLSDLYQKAKEDIHQSLSDSFNTPKSIEVLQQLVKSTNAYIKDQSFSIKKDLLNSIAEYVTSILQVFGFSSLHDASQTTGFPWDGSHPAVTEKVLGELLNEFCKSRDNIRSAARQKLSADDIKKLCGNPFSNHALPDTIYQQVFKIYQDFLATIEASADKPVEVLSICDRIRDDTLPYFGIRFEDDSYIKNASTWKLDSVQATLKDRENRKLEFGARNKKKRAAAEEKLRQQQLKDMISQIPVNEFFKQHPNWAGKFATYDESGFPLTTLDGKAISKGEVKRATTAWTKFKKEKGQK